MKLLWWAWGAILADFGLFLSPLPLERSLWVFVAVWSLHALCCLVLAASCYMLLPLRYRLPRLPILALLFCFALIAPVLGAIAVLLIAQLTLQRELAHGELARLQALALPEYDVRAAQVTRAAQGAVRMRLAEQVPEEVRMKSLLTLQVVPSRVANPILEDLLDDATEDVRLLAFGMRDKAEKRLTGQIQRERERLAGKLTASLRYDCLRRQAELHWELIYASLAQGELRRYMLGEARRYVEEALSYGDSSDGGLHFLHARILMAQQAWDAAATALGHALSAGLTEVTALPYLAEIAFQNRRFGYVHGVMQRLAELKLAGKAGQVVGLWTGHTELAVYERLAPRAQAIVDIWTGRDNALNFGDSHVHYHL